MRDRWNGLSLALQYGIAGGVVLACAMVAIGLWVTRVIEDGIKSNAASATALYVDSVIAPLLPELREDKPLDAGVQQALDEVLSQGALGDRLASFKVWRRDGRVIYALDARQSSAKNFRRRTRCSRPGTAVSLPSSTSLATPKAPGRRAKKVPLLEIYSPIREPWSGEVVPWSLATSGWPAPDDCPPA